MSDGLLDELRVRAVLERYCALLDAGRAEDLLTLFDEDCSFAMMGRTFEGKADLSSAWAGLTPRERPGSAHICFNPVITVNGDRADATSGWAMVDRGAEGGRTQIAMAGRYHDRLRRGSDGAWRFTSRRAESLARPEAAPR